MDELIYFGDAVKALGDGKVGGYLCRFTEDYDLTSERFAKDTDFGEVARLPVLYHHGMDAKIGKRRIGTADVKKDDVGLWTEAQLNLRDEYEKAIYEMAQKGKLSWSSGAAGHAVERTSEGKGQKITQWYIAEASLTPTPAEPRNIAIPLKSLVAPEAEAQAVGDTAPQAASGTITTSNVKTEVLMAEQTKPDAPAAAPVDEKGEVTVLTEQVKALQAQLEEMKKAPAVNVAVPNIKVKTKRGFANDEMESFAHYLKTGDPVPYRAAMKAANQGQTDSEGGYAVPDDFYNQVIEKRDEVSVMRQIGKAFMPTQLDRIIAPTESTAATKLVRAAEEGSYDADNPVLGQLVVTIHKFTKRLDLSEELEMDSPAFMRYMANLWGRAQGLAENYGFFNVASTGTNSIQSVTYAATAGTACASQTATTAAELVGLIYAIGSAYSDNLVLVMRRATLGALRGIQGNPFNFIPNTNFSIGTGDANTSRSAGSIHGVPVFCTDDLPAQAAAVRHIVLFNPDFYFCAERLGLTVTRNPYLLENSGQIAYFARSRFGGALAQSAAAYYMPSKT